MGFRLPVILIAVILNLMVYSFCFARPEAASVIIQNRIDELWTTGTLNVGLAKVASKHWLPDLYERNDFKLLWHNPNNVTDLLNDVKRIAEDGLDPEDYHLSQLLVLKLRLEDSKSPDPALLADYDILLTDCLVRLCYHLQFGKVDPESLDPAWKNSGPRTPSRPAPGSRRWRDQGGLSGTPGPLPPGSSIGVSPSWMA